MVISEYGNMGIGGGGGEGRGIPSFWCFWCQRRLSLTASHLYLQIELLYCISSNGTINNKIKWGNVRCKKDKKGGSRMLGSLSPRHSSFPRLKLAPLRSDGGCPLLHLFEGRSLLKSFGVPSDLYTSGKEEEGTLMLQH